MTAATLKPIGSYPDFIDTTTSTPACRGHNTELFFPIAGNPGTYAKTICQRCPLLDTCREWALQQPDTQLYGIWGGMSDLDRRRWHRSQNSTKPRSDECQHCGTYVGRFRRIHMARRHPNLAVAA